MFLIATPIGQNAFAQDNAVETLPSESAEVLNDDDSPIVDESNKSTWGELPVDSRACLLWELAVPGFSCAPISGADESKQCSSSNGFVKEISNYPCCCKYVQNKEKPNVTHEDFCNLIGDLQADKCLPLSGTCSGEVSSRFGHKCCCKS